MADRSGGTGAVPDEGGGAAEGIVERIWLKRVRRGPMDAVEEAELVADRGIVGNANQGGRRQVTLISRGAWSAVEAELGEEVDPASRRANLLVAGIALAESRGRVLRVGPCRLRIEGETKPCRLMDEEHPGLQEALGPEWRGGVFAAVLDGGRVRRGDSVAWVD
ncbi:MAG TPA: MOSC domain-containing protein [Longimicrobiales bacterium]|nr:MOSC domain-containing protein [Longimicrobiales bacterium]